MHIEAMAEAWRRGDVCLHPTDTLPGLSFNPGLESAVASFMAIKTRPEDKRPISLIADFPLAVRLYRPLPSGWESILQNLWPASLSVIWQASDLCPRSLVADDGTVALRMPAWSQDRLWMRDLLRELDQPFPSSSVNRSGDPAAENWDKALRFVENASRRIFVPTWTPAPAESQVSAPGLPSTVIRLHGDGTFAMLREGALSRATIEVERQRHAGIQRS